MILVPEWEAPPWVRCFTTTRSGGVSTGAYESLNLGAHVGDELAQVQTNRQLVQSQEWDTPPLWLGQCHGTDVVRAEDWPPDDRIPQADGSVTVVPGRPLVVMTADCLPVVACDRSGTVVGVFHAGWKGLLAGILEAGVKALRRRPQEILVWIGPCVGQDSYQVGPEVRQAYLAADDGYGANFQADGPGHWKFDLAGAAIHLLARLGVAAVTRSPWDTYLDVDRFFSHRRQGPCGRQGTFVWLAKRSLS